MNEITRKIEKKFGEIVYHIGDEYKVTCLKCKKRALTINVSKKVFRCYFCDYRGKLFVILNSNFETPVRKKRKEKTFSGEILPSMYRKIKSRNDSKVVWDYVISRGINPEKIEIGTVDEKYVIFPVRENGKLVYYQSRTTSKFVKRRTTNPSIGVGKTNFIFNYDSLKLNDVAIIVEGVFDAFHVNGISFLGKTISDEQIKKLAVKKPKLVIVLLDGDVPRIDIIKFSNTINRKGMKTIPVYLDKGDPADLGYKNVYNLIFKQLNLKHSKSLSQFENDIYSLLLEKYSIAEQYAMKKS